jgi:hypothetical protein
MKANTCRLCGGELEWVVCTHEGCLDGYDPTDQACEMCNGIAGWWACPSKECALKRAEDARTSAIENMVRAYRVTPAEFEAAYEKAKRAVS